MTTLLAAGAVIAVSIACIDLLRHRPFLSFVLTVAIVACVIFMLVIAKLHYGETSP